MKMAIAVECPRHPKNRQDYKVWYLEIDQRHEVVGLGSLKRRELVREVLENFQKNGETDWRAFLKNNSQSTEISVYDFLAQGIFDNTHFGSLPTIDEFQTVLDQLGKQLQLKSLAS